MVSLEHSVISRSRSDPTCVLILCRPARTLLTTDNRPVAPQARVTWVSPGNRPSRLPVMPPSTIKSWPFT
jgi:hypothetical protein